MKKALYKILTLISVILIMVFVVPFHITHADTLTSSNIVGVNCSLYDWYIVDADIAPSFSRYTFTFKFELILDDDYTGYITGKFTNQYYGYVYDSQSQSYVFDLKTLDTGSKNFYVNGNKLTYYQQVNVIWSDVSLNAYTYIYNSAFTLSGSNVIQSVLLNTIEDIQLFVSNIYSDTSNIVQYLYDSQNGSIIEVTIDQLRYLHDINESMGATMLNTTYISLMRQYDVPIYSWSIVWSSFKNLDLVEIDNFNITDMYGGIYFNYPLFVIPNGTSISLFSRLYMPSGSSGTLIFGIANETQNTNVVNLTNNQSAPFTYKRDTLYTYYLDDSPIRFIKINFSCDRTVSTRLNINNNTGEDLYFIPILFVTDGTFNYDVDFASMYGLSNPILDKLEIIANGTTSSQNSSSQLEVEQNTFDTQAQDMYSYENTFNSDMNSNLQNINTNFDIGNTLGSKFMYSANWVKTQFDTMTNNTPIGTVISFSLLLGLAMLLIGKAL